MSDKLATRPGPARHEVYRRTDGHSDSAGNIVAALSPLYLYLLCTKRSMESEKKTSPASTIAISITPGPATTD